MDNLIKRLSNLLSVKSLVTIILTAVFAYLAVTGSFIDRIGCPQKNRFNNKYLYFNYFYSRKR